ncbi:MAG: hypothetical protein NZM38_07985 [Cytophagales bacterium]|nr:hypothetical protein [Cytophagales bacterium]MDW8384697.1 hypothetical protein [Flammeovirgaceae bacterium]
MKKCILLLFLLGFLGSCHTEDTALSEPQTEYRPVLANREDLDKLIHIKSAQPIKQKGKIYFKNNFIFLVEPQQGIHIIDNRRPEEPHQIGFIEIPACVDVAAKGNILYADNATDLVLIDISNPFSPKLIKRLPNVFPDLLPPDNGSIPEIYTPAKRPKNTVIIRWEKP